MLSFSPSAEDEDQLGSGDHRLGPAGRLRPGGADTAGNGLVGSVLAAVLRDIVAQPLEWLLGPVARRRASQPAAETIAALACSGVRTSVFTTRS